MVSLSTSGVPEEITIPNGAKYAKFTSNADFYAAFGSVTLPATVLRPEDLINKNDLSSSLTQANSYSLLNPEIKAIGNHDSIKLKAGLWDLRKHSSFGVLVSQATLGRRYEIKKVGTTAESTSADPTAGTCSIPADNQGAALNEESHCVDQGICTVTDTNVQTVNTLNGCNGLGVGTTWAQATWTPTTLAPSSDQAWYAISTDFTLGVCSDGTSATRATCLTNNGTWTGDEKVPSIGDRFFTNGIIPDAVDENTDGVAWELESENVNVTIEFFS